MSLTSLLNDVGTPRPNRKITRRPSGTGRSRSPASSHGETPLERNKKRDRTRGASKARQGLRRLGAVVWPERFPDLAASRAERIAARRVSQRGFIWIWAIAVALATMAFLVHLHIRFDIIQTGYALSRAQAEQRRQRLTQRELRLELATLKEPGRIEAQARTDLGMDRPDYQRIIRLDEQRSSQRKGKRGGR